MSRVLGLTLGIVAAPVFALMSFVRRRRAAHPVGVAYAATLTVTDPPSPLVAGTVLGSAGDHAALVRLSRGIGLPVRMADVHGFAIRLTDAAQDLLLVTVKRGRKGRDVICRTARYGPRFSSVLKFGAPGGNVVFSILPLQPLPPDDVVDGGHASGLAFELRAEPPGGIPEAVARIVLGRADAPEQAERMRFDPWHDGGGLTPIGAFNEARRLVYPASQWARSLRGG